MAAGCPVIGANTGGIPEIIRDGENGLLVQPRNPTAIANAVLALAAEETQLRRDVIEQAHLTAERYNVAAHVEHIQALYDSLLDPLEAKL